MCGAWVSHDRIWYDFDMMFWWRTHTHAEHARLLCTVVGCRFYESFARYDIQLSCEHHVILEGDSNGALATRTHRPSRSDRRMKAFFLLLLRRRLLARRFIILLFFFGVFFVFFSAVQLLYNFRLQQLRHTCTGDMLPRNDSIIRIRSSYRMILVCSACSVRCLYSHRATICSSVRFVLSVSTAHCERVDGWQIFVSKVNTKRICRRRLSGICISEYFHFFCEYFCNFLPFSDGLIGWNCVYQVSILNKQWIVRGDFQYFRFAKAAMTKHSKYSTCHL